MCKKVLLILVGFCLFNSFVKSQEIYTDNWESLDSRETPQWFSDAKFGIFIHWGLYSVPAFSTKGTYAEWYGHALNGDTSIMNQNQLRRHRDITAFHNSFYGKDFEYKDFREKFTCELFNPDEWADILKNSGAKYVVLTSKHHDGYCLWPNNEASESFGTAWNTVESGPQRDLVGELTKSVRNAGLKMGLYYSIWDWFNPYWTEEQQLIIKSGINSEMEDSQTIKDAEEALNKYIDKVMYPQFKDLVQNYQPSLIFSDGDWWMDDKKWQTKALLAWTFNNAPNKEELVINDRWGKVRGKHGGYFTTEYGSGFSDDSKPWEENRGIGMSFGYNRNENINDYRTSKEIIFMLVDIVSRGGNLLLNIGPRADGIIPVIMQERLIQIGDWLDVNGEAIFETKMWEKSTQWSNGQIPEFFKSDYHTGFPIYEMTINPKPGNAVIEVWFTSKDDKLYAFTPEWPKADKLLIKDITVENISNVSLLGFDKVLDWKYSNNEIEISLKNIPVHTLPGKYIFVFKIEY